jgi:hypothetical protein
MNEPQDMNDEALAIIVRRRPELAGKTLDECRAILKAQYPSAADLKRSKQRGATRRKKIKTSA